MSLSEFSNYELQASDGKVRIRREVFFHYYPRNIATLDYTNTDCQTVRDYIVFALGTCMESITLDRLKNLIEFLQKK
jgi:hypothetical protein